MKSLDYEMECQAGIECLNDGIGRSIVLHQGEN